jgi:alkylated DNA repair dioxygenase AlkB
LIDSFHPPSPPEIKSKNKKLRNRMGGGGPFPLDPDGNPIDHVPGLEYYPEFLSPEEQSDVLSLIDSNPWQTGVIARRQQFYGEVYYYTSFKSKVLQGCDDDDNNVMSNTDGTKRQNKGGGGANSGEDRCRPEINDNENSVRKTAETCHGIPMDDSGMKTWLDKTLPFFRREGLDEAPTQVLINEYRNNMGIASHFEDFDAFGPVILTISLVSPVYMTLKKPTAQPTKNRTSNINITGNAVSNNNNNNNNNESINACDTYDDVVKVFLEPGSLLVMKGDARYKYRHGIGKYKWVKLPPGRTTARAPTAEDSESTATPTTIKRDDSYRRVSLTIRHLLSTRRRVRDNEDESHTIKNPSVY